MDDYFEDSITALAFEFHLKGGQKHMYTGTFYNPMLIFSDQCACFGKARAKREEQERKIIMKRNIQNKQEDYFSNLFEPRVE